MFDLKSRIESPTYHYTKIQNKLHGELLDFVDKPNMNQTKLGKILGVKRSYISQLLKKGADHKLSNLIKLSLGINKIPVLEFYSPEEYLIKERKLREESKPLVLGKMELIRCNHRADNIISTAKPVAKHNKVVPYERSLTH